MSECTNAPFVLEGCLFFASWSRPLRGRSGALFPPAPESFLTFLQLMTLSTPVRLLGDDFLADHFAPRRFLALTFSARSGLEPATLTLPWKIFTARPFHLG